MAIIYSYPKITSLDTNDRFIISKMDQDNNPTKSLSFGDLVNQILPLVPPSPPPAGTVSGVGITNYIMKWTDGPNSIAGDSKLFDNTTDVQSEVDFVLKPNGAGPSAGSVNLDFKGVDDLGAELVGARIFTTDSTINPSGQDLHIQNASDAGTLGTNIFVDAFGFVGLGTTSPLANLDVAQDLIVGTDVTFSDYGSGTKTGTSTYNLAVDASGNVIEETSSAPTFDATNSEASPNIVLGVSALAAAGGSDGVFIGNSFGTASGSNGQINIGEGNDTTGTQNIQIGHQNSQINNGAYSIALGSKNDLEGNTTAAIGRENTMGTTGTYTFGRNNSSTFTGGVSSGGLMNLSIGYDNSLDIDKGLAIGFSNDITGSYGWTLGGGNETVVIGTRTTMSILGPNRSATTGPRVIIATGEFIGAGPENKKNSVEYYTPTASTSGVYHPALYNSASYADDVAAAAGGVGLGELYRNGSVVQIRMS